MNSEWIKVAVATLGILAMVGYLTHLQEKYDHVEYVINQMPEEEYYRILYLLERRDGDLPTRQQIVDYYEESNKPSQH